MMLKQAKLGSDLNSEDDYGSDKYLENKIPYGALPCTKNTKLILSYFKNKK